jgi:hypothetical protein
MWRRAGLVVAALAAAALLSGVASGAARGRKVKVVWPEMAQAKQHQGTFFIDKSSSMPGPPEEAKTWERALGGPEHGYLRLYEPVVISYRPPEYTANGSVLREAEVVREDERREAGWSSVKLGDGGLAAIIQTEFGPQPTGPIVQRNPEWQWPCKLAGAPGKVVMKAKGAVVYADLMQGYIPISQGFRVVFSLTSPKEGSRIELAKGRVLPILGVVVKQVKTKDGESHTRTGYIVVSDS